MENILDKEIGGKDIALASFSGYLAFSSNLLENGRVILKAGEKLPFVGVVFFLLQMGLLVLYLIARAILIKH